MTGILMLESLTRGNTLKQGDKTPLTYRLLDADGDNLNIAGKTATVRLVYPNYLTIGYEKSGLLVSQDDTVTFTIDNVIPSRKYNVEIIVDNKYVFPSRSAESKFTIDKSTLGNEANIIEIIGKDVLIREVKEQVKIELEPILGGIGEVELTNYATKDYVDTAVSDVQAPDLSDYVLSNRVLTDVPSNAKFTDTTYTAGTGINITDDVISATGEGGEVDLSGYVTADQLNTAINNIVDNDTVYDDTALKKRVSDLEEAPSNGMSIVVLESYEEYEALTPDTNTIYLIKGDTEIEPRIEVKRESRTIAIPFDTKSEDNATLNVGQTAVKQVGKDGVRTILEDVTYTDGVETSRVDVSSSITTQPVDEIIWIGTKPIADNATFENNYASEITPITNGYQLELTSANGGLIISGIAITTAGRYKLEFNIKKLSGNFKSLGGHVDGNYSVGNAVYYDGENVGNSWADGFVIPTDDENTHSVKVEFDVSSGINTVDAIYISPNRQQTTWADAHGLFEVTNISMKRV